MEFLTYDPETGPLVDTPRGEQHTVRPQRHLPVPGPLGEANAFLDQAASEAKTARRGLDEHQSEPGDLIRLPDDKDRAHDFAVPLGDPAPLPLRIEVLDELGGDLRDQRLELLVPSILLRVQDAVPVDD